MKTKLTLLITLLFVSIAFGQKKTVAITAFETKSNNISSNYVKAIEDKVKEAFHNTNRFHIVDRTSMDKIKREKELQKTEDFIDGKTVMQSNFDGATQLITGSISQVDISKIVSKDNSYYYDCKISFSLQVIDTESGQVLASELIQPKKSLMGGLGDLASIGSSNTPQKAFLKSLNGTQKSINKFVGKHFPVTTSIIEISKATSSKAKLLLINSGANNGAKKNQIFSVNELKSMEVNGKNILRKKMIGKIKITKVEGDEISEAKVIKGGEEILSKFKSGVKIECYSLN
ncbi:CsgG/HfaB family protein [Aureivirga sp. CE67]|uniref:CsgG/HfaB family protein n=1 Tax=Aureivirga sp. CE67 TaxID=1788983 RepID=UPI0018C95DA8|nr:CsgG/HfaB family protein [Aureivirga sp. CE67]